MRTYKTNYTKLIVLLSISLSSCLEQLDEAPQSFARVYGSAGTTEVTSMTKLNNGHLLICGEEFRPASESGSNVSGPFLVETDEQGNQVRYRNYTFYKGEFELRLTSVDEVSPGYYGTNEFTTVWSSIAAVKQLRDGSFFCLGWFGFRPKDTSWPTGNSQFEDFYLLLDKNLEPTKWGFFDDSEAEGPPQFFTNINPHNIIELSSGEIIFSAFYTEWDDNLSLVGRGFSIHKFLPQSGTTEVHRYSSADANLHLQARGLVLSNDGASLIVDVIQAPVTGLIGSGSFASIAQTSFYRIDLTSGAVLNSRIYYTLGISFNLTPGDNGYVAQVYHPDPGDEIESTTRNWWGSLLFVDENLDSLKLVNITDAKNILVGNKRIISTRDGGFVTEFQKNKENGYVAVLIKTDAKGNVLWRHEEGPNTWIQDIMEMDDGGIAYTLSKDFNGIGKRVTLVKLTAAGKL